MVNIKKFFVPLFSVAFLFLAAESFAAYSPGDYIIYTWGYSDIMRNMLSAVAGVMNSATFAAVFKLAAVVSLFVIALSLLSDRQFSLAGVGQKIVLVILFQVLMTSAPYDTYIADVTTATGTAAVDPNPVTGPRGERIPVVVAFPLYVMSGIEKGLYEAFKDSLSRTPGMIGAMNDRTLPISTSLNLLLATSSYRITDLNLNKTLDSFVSNCIVPDMISGYYDMEAMGTSASFFNEWQDVHGMRFTNYYDKAHGGFDGWIMNCREAYAKIRDDLNRATGINGEAFRQIAGSVGLAANKAIHDQMGIISREMMNYVGNAQGLMQNAIAVNSFNAAYTSIAASAGIDVAGLNYGQAKAQEIARMNSSLSAIMAKKYLPLAKGYLSVIFVAIIPILIIIALATGNFKKPVAMILGLLMALSLWGIGEQLLDFIITVRVHSLLGGTGGLSLANQPVVDQSILDAISLSLGMYWTVPTLAFAIASMSGYAANSVMGGIGSSVMSGASAAAGEAAVGSRSLGIVRNSMISGNKFDLARNDSMGTYTGVKYGKDSSMHNNDSLSMNTTSEGVGADNLNWKTTNNVRTGEGRDDSGNLVSMKQYKSADGSWHNQELKTTYTGGVDIPGGRGETMRLGAGATSTQYADGTTSYSGVSDKFGKIDAIYGGDGKLGFINGMKGHEYASKHNSINEDMFVNRTNVSNDYTGEMTINGEQAFGRYMYDKDNGQGVFSGQIGGDKVDMTLDNVNGFRIDERGEQNSMAHINGDVGQMSVNGSKTTVMGTKVDNLGYNYGYSADSIYQNGIKALRDGNGEYAGLRKDYDNLQHLKAYAAANPENTKAAELYNEASDSFTSKAAGFVNAAAGAVQKEFSADKAFQESYKFGKDHAEGIDSKSSMTLMNSVSIGGSIGDKWGSIKNTIANSINAKISGESKYIDEETISRSNSSKDSFGNSQASSSSIRDNLVVNNVAKNLMESLENNSSANDFYSNLGNRDNYIPGKKK